MDTNYQVTVAVLTYNPNKEKLFATLRSVLLQKNVHYQVVIADDGSRAPLTEEVKDFFAQHGFQDYVLVPNAENRGTVYNILSAAEHSSSPYVKPISPGDMLSGETVLQEWVAEASAEQAGLSFCDAVYYHAENGSPCAMQGIAHPQNVRCYRRRDFEQARYRYIVLNDLFLGAATLCHRDTLIRYLKEICGKAVYAEDHAYRLMAYDRVPVHYFQKTALIYESGTGISTSGNTEWLNKLYKDAAACTEILLARPVEDSDKTAQIYQYLEREKKKDPLSKIIKFIRVRGLLTRKLKPKWLYRKTRKDLPQAFMKKIFRDKA